MFFPIGLQCMTRLQNETVFNIVLTAFYLFQPFTICPRTRDFDELQQFYDGFVEQAIKMPLWYFLLLVL